MNNTSCILTSKIGILPSYLHCFEEGKVHLIFAKRPSLTSVGDENNLIYNNEDDEVEESVLDLTGDPLKIDLGYDAKDIMEITAIQKTFPKWDKEESKHFPLSVRDARRELNKILKKGMSALNHSFPIYVVCDASDSKKTILLGGNCNNFMACSVHGAGTVLQQDVEKSMEKMVDDHLESCFKENKVDYLVNMSYDLYGKNFKNVSNQNQSLRDQSVEGHIYVDIVTTKRTFKLTSLDAAQVAMHITLVAGHPNLKLNALWKELVALQSLIDCLLFNKDISALSASTPLEEDAVLKGIDELISMKILDSNAKENLCYSRPLDMLDMLWSLLLCCENVSVLKNSFVYFFEQLFSKQTTELIIKDDWSSICSLVNDLMQGRMAVPSVSARECIELLYELGARKLKLDFQAILMQFSPRNNLIIDSVWRSFFNIKQQEQEIRKTRATRLFSNFTNQNINMKTEQLAFLSQLYLATEFIYLAKEEITLTDDGFQNLYLYIEKNYLTNSKLVRDFNTLKNSPLAEMSFNLKTNHILCLDGMFPSQWTLTMKTGPQTTIYNLSSSPLFPPTIYKYDVSTSGGNPKHNHYYVTKMSRSYMTIC